VKESSRVAYDDHEKKIPTLLDQKPGVQRGCRRGVGSGGKYLIAGRTGIV